jgi:hypothetical protein
LPFWKFFNYGEPNAASIDWESAVCTEKKDGSLLKITRHGDKLLLSTNGMIDAFKSNLVQQPGCPYKTYGALALDTLKKYLGQDAKKFSGFFEEGFTYMFELCTPWNKVVIPHKDCSLFFIGCRDNKTFQESRFWEHPMAKVFPTPRIFPMKTLGQCLSAAEKLPWDEEGYVVVDKDFNRVKIKSPQYLAVHRLSGNGVMSAKRSLDIVKLNEIEEICSYFPEFRKPLETAKNTLDGFVKTDETAWEKLKAENLPDRKSQASWVLKNFRCPSAAFTVLDGKAGSIKDWYYSQNSEKLAKLLGLKDSGNETETV